MSEQIEAARIDMAQLRGLDWEGLEREVVTKIRLLRATVEQLEVNPLTDQMAGDLFAPCVQMLGMFCAAVEVGDEADSAGT